MADEKLTEELLNELLFTNDLNEYLNMEDVAELIKLSDYLSDILEKKGLKKSTVIKKSMLNQTFAYQIFAGERNAGRDKLIQLAFGMELNLRETQRLLYHGGANELYPKNKRDAIIIHCIVNNKDLEETDQNLFKFGERTIYAE